MKLSTYKCIKLVHTNLLVGYVNVHFLVVVLNCISKMLPLR